MNINKVVAKVKQKLASLEWSKSQENFVREQAVGYYTEMKAKDFLKLTLGSSDYEEMENSDWTKLMGKSVDDMKFQEKYIIPPFLKVDKSGNVIGHEGRHRVFKNKSPDKMSDKIKIAIVPDSKSYYVKLNDGSKITDYEWMKKKLTDKEKVKNQYRFKFKDANFDLSKIKTLKGQFSDENVPIKIEQDEDLLLIV